MYELKCSVNLGGAAIRIFQPEIVLKSDINICCSLFHVLWVTTMKLWNKEF